MLFCHVGVLSFLPIYWNLGQNFTASDYFNNVYGSMGLQNIDSISLALHALVFWANIVGLVSINYRLTQKFPAFESLLGKTIKIHLKDSALKTDTISHILKVMLWYVILVSQQNNLLISDPTVFFVLCSAEKPTQRLRLTRYITQYFFLIYEVKSRVMWRVMHDVS